MSDTKVDPLDATHAESSASASLVAGTPIGGFALERVLGEGGMGVVWAARDPVLDRTIAIKVLKRGDAAPALRLRLLREARAMARLKHPNVLTVYEVGTEGERDFIAMELVDGGPLDEWLARDPPRDEVIAAVLAAGRGLAAAHAAGLVHRDFKPNNVLRGRDGRVLVTDFGLARGMAADEGAQAPDPPVSLDAAIATGHRADSVLHSPLTRTGAMIGTPAYMAPEQYRGSQPDPRTDQFAFCVTAWQALTGARPYHGRTLEEMHAAVSAGIDHVVADLDKPVRAVLARGLDPDPARRWPDLPSLLAAFEHAARPRRKVPVPVLGGLAAAGGVVIAIAVASSGGKAEAPAACEPAAAMLDRAIVPADAPAAAVFAASRRRWTAAYDDACRALPQRAARERVDCLIAIRDRTLVAGELPALSASAVAVLLPDPGACTAPHPVAPAAIPPAPRKAVVDVFGRLPVLATSANVWEDAAALETRARASGWPPLVAMVRVAAGEAYVRAGDLGRARDALTAAIAAASDDPRTVAFARIALVEASLVELEAPGDTPTTRPEQPHEEHARLLTYARAAVKAAGEEPILVGLLAVAEARVAADVAARSKKPDFGEARAHAAAASASFGEVGDRVREADVAALAIELDLAQAAYAGTGERALEHAAFTALTAAKRLEDAHLPPSSALDRVAARLAFARGNYEEAHELFDRIQPLHPTSAPLARGRVVDADGNPAVATVVAWTGELHGDPLRVFTDPATLAGEVVETGADGTFAIRAPAGAAVIAQRGELRSTPRLLDEDQPLRLLPTTEVMGKVELEPARPPDARPPLVDAYTRFAVGANAWFLHVPVQDSTFRLHRVPKGAALFGTIGTRLDGTTRRLIARTARALAWPTGRTYDVIARAPAFEDGATAWMFREASPDAPRTRAEVVALAATSTDVVVAPLVPIGARTTDAGRALYAAGDRHAIVIGGPFVHGTACIAPRRAPASAVACAVLDGPAVRVELADR